MKNQFHTKVQISVIIGKKAIRCGFQMIFFNRPKPAVTSATTGFTNSFTLFNLPLHYLFNHNAFFVLNAQIIQPCTILLHVHG